MKNREQDFDFTKDVGDKLDVISKLFSKYPIKSDLFHLIFGDKEEKELPALYFEGFSDGSIEELLLDMNITDFVVYSRINKLLNNNIINEEEAKELYSNYGFYKRIKAQLDKLFEKSKKDNGNIDLIKSIESLYYLLNKHLEVINKYNLLSSFDFEEAIAEQINKEFERNRCNIKR